MHCEQDCECGEYRMFLTKDEKIEKLSKYKDWLDSEAKGVSEAISDLKKAK